MGQKKTTHPCTVRSHISLFGSKTPFGGLWLFYDGASVFLMLIVNENSFVVNRKFFELVFGTRTYYKM